MKRGFDDQDGELSKRMWINPGMSRLDELEYQVKSLQEKLSRTISMGGLQLANLNRKISEMELVNQTVTNENLALRGVVSKTVEHMKNQEQTIYMFPEN